MADDDAILSFDDMPSFDEMPDAPEAQPSGARASAPQAVPAFDDIPSFDDMPEAPKAEGQAKTFAREAAHSAAPAAGGMLAAGAAGAAAGTLGAGPVGTFLGGLAGMIIGSMATDKAQEYALEQLGFDDSQQRAANIQENPYTAFAGGLAPAVATMSPVKGVQALQRGAGGVMMGGFEAGQEFINEGHVDPLKVGGAAVVGAAFPQANRVGEALLNTGARAGTKAAGYVPGRPNKPENPAAVPAQDEAASSQQATVTGESSLQQPAPTEAGETTGNPQSAPARSSRTYPKGASAEGRPAGYDPLTTGDFAPDVSQALQASLDANSVKPTELPAIPPQEPRNPDMLNPGETLPIKTGIEEAGAAPVAAEQAAPKPKRIRKKAPVETGIEEAAAQREEQPIVGEFTTAKGSTYALHPDGTTTRNKAARAEHPGDEGLKPRSEKTYFLTPEQANALAPPQDSRFMIVDHGDGKLSTATPNQEGKWGIAPSQRNVGPVSAEPKEGLHPLEVWSGKTSNKHGNTGYGAAHFGNEIAYLGQNKPREKSPVLSDEGLLEASRAQREGAANAEARAAEGRQGLAFDELPNEHPAAKVVESAAADTNTAPSGPQIDAGNYKKGGGRLHGREVKIENPQGSIRRNKPGSEPKWEVEMPYDYGDIKGTKGADGDNIDIAVGKGDRHFVIDQKNAETGKFDEHKVFSHFKDVNDAIDHYNRGFSDNKGPDRLMSIKEVTDGELREWLREPGKKKTPFNKDAAEVVAPSEGVKPLPKVVTVAVNELRGKGMTEAAAKLEAMPDAERLKVASQYVNKTGADLARPNRIKTPPPTVEGILNDNGQPVTANSKASAAAKSADVKTMNEAFEKHAPEAKVPSTPEEKAAMRQQVQDFVDATKDVTYRPALKHAPYLYARAAKKLLTAKNPTDKSWTEFTETLAQLKAGGEKDVRQGQRINADIERSRRSGDEAILKAEERNAATNNVEDEMIANIDAKRAGKDEGYLDVPHEEAETMVKPEPVKTAEDVKKFDVKQADLDLAKPADRMKLQEDTAKLADNLVKQPRKPPVGESEGAASPVRKVALDPKMLADIMERAKKAEAKNKTDAGVREEELGKHDIRVQARDKLAEFWNDEGGGLDYKKVAQDFRGIGKAAQRFYTEVFGGLANDRQRRVDAVLAKVLSTEDSRLAEKSRQLFEARYYQWLDQTKTAERMTYLKTIERPANDTPAKLRAEFKAAGMPQEKIDWMTDEAIFHRKLMDQIWREDAAHGSDAGYVQNYVTHIFTDKKIDGKTADQFIHARVQNLGPTWYQKERVFDLMEAAIKAGFKLKFENPVEIINARWAASIRSNTIVAAARALHEEGLAFPVKDLPETHKALLNTWGYKRQLPDRQQWIFSPDAAALWENSIEPHGLNENRNLPGSMYRTWMQIKNFMVPVQLMLSQFHAFHVVGNIMPAQALYNAMERSRANGSWFKNFAQAGKEIATDGAFAVPLSIPGVGNWLHDKTFFKDHVGRQIQDIWRTADADLNPRELMTKRMFQEAGVSPYQSREDIIGAKRKFADAVSRMTEDPSIKGAGAVAVRGLQRGMELLQEPLFKHTIPALKNAALLRGMSTALEKHPDLASNPSLRQQVFRELGKDIDDRFGEMFYKGLFWDKTLKDIGIGSMLSLSWNLGQFRQVAGATAQGTRIIRDAIGLKPTSTLQQARETASNKIGFVTAYVGLSMATAGAISWALTGKFPTDLTDYVFPRSGQLDPETGHPQRLTSPFNTREAIMLKAHADEHNSWMGGAMQLLWNKMVLQPVTELWSNKDFFGRALYDTNAPAWKQTLQAIDSTLGRTLSPISISGADRARQQGTGVKGQALSFLGFGPGPKYVNEEPIERRINHLSHTYAPGQRPYEYGNKTGAGRGLVQGAVRYFADDELKSEARTSARNALNQARTAGDSAAELEARRKMVEKGELSTRIVGKMAPGRQFEGEFARLPKEEQLAVAKTMSDQDFQRFVLTNKDLPRQARMALMEQWTKQRSVNR